METTYNPKLMLDTFWDAALILKRGVRNMTPYNTRTGHLYSYEGNDPYQLVPHVIIRDREYTRPWHVTLQSKFAIHPVVIKAMEMARPDDWQRLLLEWPHRAESDPTRLAYTVNERKGDDDVQTMTTVGKYLTRHFSTLPDHAIRDLAALCGKGECKIVRTSVEMIYHLERGPKSCMQWGVDHDPDYHPYQVYDPQYGWGMAVRMVGGETIGRALVITSEGEKYFVRSYLRNDQGYSGRDDVLEAWLRADGYEHRSEWNEGQRLRRIDDDGNNCGFIAPYIDGSNQRVSKGSGNVLIMDRNGDYDCCNTDGDADQPETTECNDCGDRINDGDGYWVGYHEDNYVCNYCHDNYRFGRGRNGREYSFHEDNAVYVESQDNYYHGDYLEDNNIVQLENGEYEHVEETIEIDGEFYTQDDERICFFKDTEEWGLQEDGWQCVHSCDWYTDDTDYVEVNGEKFHPDYCPETEAK
jgi:hypothetical protein